MGLSDKGLSLEKKLSNFDDLTKSTYEFCDYALSSKNVEKILTKLVFGFFQFLEASGAAILQLEPDFKIRAIKCVNMNGIVEDGKLLVSDEAQKIINSAVLGSSFKIVSIETENNVAENQVSSHLYVFPLVVSGENVGSLVVKVNNHWDLDEHIRNCINLICLIVATIVLNKKELETEDSDRLKLEHSSHEIGGLGLSEKQIQIAKMIANGKTNRQIAREMGFSEATIRYETIKLYERLRVRNRPHAAAIIREHNLA